MTNEFSLRPGVDFCVSKEEFLRKQKEEERERIQQALDLATEIHQFDIRKTTGEPYVNHCIAVAEILSLWGADGEEIVAGLLHDTVEDHPELISLNDIREMFGDRVAHLVDGVSKFKSPTGKDNDFETLRKVARETLVEPGVALIKLADRLHNMNTMEDGPLHKGFSEEKKVAKAKETLAVYVPLAESLGLWEIKNALADISFRYIDPEQYWKVKNEIDSDPRLNSEFIANFEREIAQAMAHEGVRARVEHHVGGYWELAEKRRKAGIHSKSRPNGFADIADVVSFRVIIVDSEKAVGCYTAMGVMRDLLGDRLNEASFDDYLRKSAPNGYSAIHDTFVLEQGNVEIAYTTKRRESFNNKGVASLSPEEMRNNPDTYKRKMIFTPKEELVFLPLGATGIDVAYKLNPLLGLRAVAIKINGEVCGLETVVPNSAMVEIVLDTHQRRPRAEWTSVCGEETKKIIGGQELMAQHDEEVARGEKKLVERVLRERGILDILDLDQDTVDKMLMDFGCWGGVNDLYYKVELGLDLDLVAQKLEEMGVTRGIFTTVLVEGNNQIGISQEVAEIIALNGGDTKSKVEKVNGDKFMIRALVRVDDKGKKDIEDALRGRYPNCIVV